MIENTIVKPLTEAQLREGLLNRIQNNSGSIIATIIQPYRGVLGEQILRSRIFQLEKEGLITIERRFRRAYVFPVNSKE